MVSQGMVGQTNARRAAGVILQIIREGKIAGEFLPARDARPLTASGVISCLNTMEEWTTHCCLVR